MYYEHQKLRCETLSLPVLMSMLPHSPPSLPTTRVLALGSRIAAAGVCGAGVSRHHPTHAQARSPVLRHAPSSSAPHPVPDSLLLTDRESGASTGATAPSRRSSIVSVVSAGRGGRRTSSGVYGFIYIVPGSLHVCGWVFRFCSVYAAARCQRALVPGVGVCHPVCCETATSRKEVRRLFSIVPGKVHYALCRCAWCLQTCTMHPYSFPWNSACGRSSKRNVCH
jgi:hypothetical protein